jgi:hypothetical protein
MRKNWIAASLMLMTPLIHGLELSEALQYSSGSPELRAFAQQYREKSDELFAALQTNDTTIARAAGVIVGELGKDLPVRGDVLLSTLVRCHDALARRSALRALGSRLDQVNPVDILALNAPEDILFIFLQHPDMALLQNEKISASCTTWLSDIRYSELTCSLIAQRGEVATWGNVIVQKIEAASKNSAWSADEKQQLITVLHQLLCTMTATQRGLSSYVGYYDLLVSDWNDTLAEKKALPPSVTDPVISRAIARLPDDEKAVLQLLIKGTRALSALEADMAKSDKTRRKALASTARLLVRMVSPDIYSAVGMETLRQMDAESVQERLQALQKISAVVLEKRDSAGLLHLIGWLDDAHPAVRTAAFDRLLRLSDEKKEFTGSWNYEANGFFPPEQVRWRLRRSLRQGTYEEQVSAMQFISSIEAKELASDVEGLLLSPSPMVVDTVIETLGHLKVEKQSGILVSLIMDEKQPVTRRVKLLAQVLEKAESNSSDSSWQAERIKWYKNAKQLSTSDGTLFSVKMKLLFLLSASASERETILNELTRGDEAKINVAFDIIEKTIERDYSYRLAGKAASYVTWLKPFLYQHEKPSIARRAGEIVSAGLNDSDQKKNVLALFSSRDEKKRLTEWVSSSAEPYPGHVLLAYDMQLMNDADMLQYFLRHEFSQLSHPWYAYVKKQGDPLTLVQQVKQLQEKWPQEKDDIAYSALNQFGKLIAWWPQVLPSVVKIGNYRLLDISNNAQQDYDYANNLRSVRISIESPQKKKVELLGKQVIAEDNDDDYFAWELVGDIPNVIEPDAIKQFTTLLQSISLTNEDHRKKRNLLLALIGDVVPDPKTLPEIDYGSDEWQILAIKFPQLRSYIVNYFSDLKKTSAYTAKEFLMSGNPDMLTVALAWIKKADDEYDVRRFLPYLLSLDSSLIEPHLDILLSSPASQTTLMKSLVKKIGRIPWTTALEVIRSENAIEGKISAYDQAALPEVQAQIKKIEPDIILRQSASLRQFRDINPSVFDVALRAAASEHTDQAAAWLRSGLPMVAGMKDLYEQALLSQHDEVWLVGAAIALKQSKLTAQEFMRRVEIIDPAALQNAAAVAEKYLKKELAQFATACEKIIERCPTECLTKWLKIVPPSTGLARVLAQRVADPAVADAVGFVLLERARNDASNWDPLMETIIAGAQGKLNFLRAK